MEQIKLIELKSFIQRIVTDSRMQPTHISLSLALCQAWIDQGFQKQYRVSRSRLMQTSHIRSIATYHKVIKELQAFGYFSYAPSYHPRRGSEVMLLGAVNLNSIQL
ncbi:MAG TPA: hypothetical protein PLM56_12975 [Cyclobacteriaceae bacterium]|nr:hypothetical protein [Cyclobacteriaceae bacterium]HRF34410.1 hypothetical protein [Cyclobacteriaceae bacterium]